MDRTKDPKNPFGKESSRYRGPAERLVPQGPRPESICTGPPLETVSDSLRVPSSAIAELAIDLDEEGWASGSCFYIGNRRFVTAGHCLFSHELGGRWASRVLIASPSGVRTISSAFRVPDEFVAGGYDRQHDYGVIDVTESGWQEPSFEFRLWTATDQQLVRKDVFHLSGYPDPFPNTMRKTTGWISQFEVTLGLRTISYTMDTLSGMSGGPLFTTFDGDRLVVGIHINGDCPNAAVRVTEDVRVWLTSQTLTS